MANDIIWFCEEEEPCRCRMSMIICVSSEELFTQQQYTAGLEEQQRESPFI